MNVRYWMLRTWSKATFPFRRKCACGRTNIFSYGFPMRCILCGGALQP